MILFEFAVILSFVEFAVRWLHVVCAIAWIGSSFYFIALDLGLWRNRHLVSGADGEEWQVHGGGFYHIEKYLVAPKNMPDHLVWFKWESYVTWLSGAALLALIYWMGAELYLIDPAKMQLSTTWAIFISATSLGLGWLIYDFLCKSPLGERPTALMILLFLMLLLMGWGYNEIFTGRATMLHLGAFTATIMSANVFFIIMPNQRIVVADLKAGKTPDPKYGKIAKLRSTHNNYLTLPVIFLMLSNHYPLVFASDYNWLIAGLVFLMGVSIRHFFNSMHARAGMFYWTWIITSVLFVLIMWLATAPAFRNHDLKLSAREEAMMQIEGFEDVANIVIGNCSMCHGATPGWAGMHWAPKNIYLDNHEWVVRNREQIYFQAGLSNAMPPRGVGFAPSAKDRAAIRAWFEKAVKL